MPLTQITDHSDAALARLPAQHQGTTNWTALIGAIAAGYQRVEDALWSLLVDRTLDSAAGAQLDVLGRIVGQPRNGMDDATYLIWLKVRIRVNRSSGTATDIHDVFALLGANAQQFRPEYPAAFTLTISDALPCSVDDAVAILGKTRMAGVRGLLEYRLQPDANTFTLSDSASADPVTNDGPSDANLGCGNSVDTDVNGDDFTGSGGALAGVAVS